MDGVTQEEQNTLVKKSNSDKSSKEMEKQLKKVQEEKEKMQKVKNFDLKN